LPLGIHLIGGGPVKKDRLSWFAGFMRQDSSTPPQVVFELLASVTPLLLAPAKSSNGVALICLYQVFTM